MVQVNRTTCMLTSSRSILANVATMAAFLSWSRGGVGGVVGGGVWVGVGSSAVIVFSLTCVRLGEE